MNGGHAPQHLAFFERLGAVLGERMHEQPAVRRIEAALGPVEPVTVSEEGLGAWHELFRTLQGAEAWTEHGEWIERTRPKLGPFCLERMRFSATVQPADVAAACARRLAVRERLDRLIDAGTVLILPSAASIAPRIDASMAEHEAVRARTIGLTSIAGLAGLPQVSLPLGELEDGPVGLSLIAARGNDALLLELVAGGLGSP